MLVLSLTKSYNGDLDTSISEVLLSGSALARQWSRRLHYLLRKE